ncbi:MAG: HAD-IIA family hydrolase [Anaerolineae bacterium]
MKLEEIRNLFIDMDGVLYRGHQVLPGVQEMLDFLDRNDIRYLLVTNNATMSQAQFSDKLAKMDVSVPPERIITSGVATAAYLATKVPPGTRINVVGEESLAREMEKQGFVIAGRDAEYVVAGLDRTVTYEKLKTATIAIRAGATFIGTNPDRTLPVENEIVPGAGSILAALVAATDVQPIIVGKPEPIILEQSMRILGARAEESAVLGDRLETDILGGYRAGLATIMVLTGISTAEEAGAYEVQPDWIFADLPALTDAWCAALV